MQSFVFQFVFHAKSKGPFIERPSVERDRFDIISKSGNVEISRKEKRPSFNVSRSDPGVTIIIISICVLTLSFYLLYSLDRSVFILRLINKSL